MIRTELFTKLSYLLKPAFILANIYFCYLALTKGTNATCETSGCLFYQDMTIFGISLWWGGIVAFSLLLICALFRLNKAGKILTSIFLVADILLLALMSLTAPCKECLIIGQSFIFVWIIYHEEIVRKFFTKNPLLKLIFVIPCLWSLFAFANLTNILGEKIQPWAIYGEEGASIALYFSPSCPACAQAITELGDNPNVIFYPIAENESDIVTIANLQKHLEAGKSMKEAYREACLCTPTPKSTWFGHMLLQWRLLKNKVAFHSMGAKVLPLITSQGMPKIEDSKAQPQNKDFNAIFGNDEASFFGCGESSSSCTPLGQE